MTSQVEKQPPPFRRFLSFKLNHVRYCYSVLHAIRVECIRNFMQLTGPENGFAGHVEYAGQLIPAIDLKQYYSGGRAVTRGHIGIVTQIEDSWGKETLASVLVDEIGKVETVMYNRVGPYDDGAGGNFFPQQLILGTCQTPEGKHLILDINRTVNDVLSKETGLYPTSPYNN